MSLRIGVSAGAVGAALALSACGGGGGGVSSDNPASLAPASAPIYVQGVIRPHGQLKTDVETVASTISGLSDPTARLIGLLDQALNQTKPLSGKHLSFANDIEPWLGSRAGLFVEGFSGSPPVAGIVQTTNPKATQKFIQDSREKGDRDSSYKGAGYLLSKGTAVGVVGDFLVVGNEAGFKDAVNVSKGGDSLGDQGDFTSTIGKAPASSLADAYVSLEGVTNAIRSNHPQSAKGLQAAIGSTAGKTALASVVPSKDSVELDLTTNAGQNVQLSDLSQLIGSFPADSFAAIGIPNLGQRIGEVIDQLQKAGVSGVSRSTIDAQLAVTGLKLDDITRVLGDLGIFAEGTDLRSLQGAAVITATDPARAQSLIGKLASLALASGQRAVNRAAVGTGFSVTDPQQLGRQPLTITTNGGRIAIGYGQRATARALSSGRGGTLAQDPTFKQALAALGGTGLSGYANLSAVFQLADGLGAIKDRGYQQARPYLNKLSYAALGSGTQGDFSTSKLVIGIRP